MADEQQQEPRRGGAGGGIGDGIRTGIGILNAFREAIEDTIQEAVERGELGPDRARRAVQDAAQRVQESFEEARERFEFVPRRDFDALRGELAELRRRVEALETARHADEAGDSGIIIEPG